MNQKKVSSEKDTAIHYPRSIYIWLITGVILISSMVVIGGITRLTDSGLSMSDWSLIMGAIPPLNEAEWDQAFERYQEFPQYQYLNSTMTQEEFKGIFFWEYLHRLTGRLTGIIFLGPFFYFWAKGYFDPPLLKRMIILLLLGASQGAMGWIMVKSGLVDIPYVSHYRLAAHLSLAFILAGYCYWVAMDVKNGLVDQMRSKLNDSNKRWLLAIGVLFWLQLLYGALVAGLDAGYMYNTFPLMAGHWIPPTFATSGSILTELLDNPGTVQWIHRVNGTIILLILGLYFWRSYRSKQHSSYFQLTGALFGILIFQYILGIFTLILNVPIALGVIHQAVAIVFWLLYLAIWHHSKIQAPH